MSRNFTSRDSNDGQENPNSNIFSDAPKGGGHQQVLGTAVPVVNSADRSKASGRAQPTQEAQQTPNRHLQSQSAVPLGVSSYLTPAFAEGRTAVATHEQQATWCYIAFF